MTPLYSPLLIDDAIVLDASTLEAYLLCSRSFRFKALAKREVAAPAPALAFGSAIHFALEHRYKVPRDEFASGLEAHEKAMIAVATSYLKENAHAFPEGDHRTPALAEQMIRDYNLEYLVEPFEVISLDDGRPAVELPFLYELGFVRGVRIMWSGKIDLIVRWDNDHIETFDHKTSSMMGSRLMDSFHMSLPQLGYLWAGRRLTANRADGYTINALAIRKPLKSGGKSTQKSFDRQRFFVEPDMLEQWQENTLAVIARMMEDEVFVQNPYQCHGKYGRCQYVDVCQAPKVAQAGILASETYRDVTWSPLVQPHGG